MTLKKREATPEERLIIDEYFVNGYNGAKAVTTVKESQGKEINYNTASTTFNKLINRDPVKQYIRSKQARLQALTDVKAEQILKELLSFAYSDITQFIGMAPSDIKLLPDEVKRCISSYKESKQYDKHGNHTGTTIEVKLIDKLKAIQMINKHIGFYSEDNRQKRVNINLNKFDQKTLNVILQGIEEQTQE